MVRTKPAQDGHLGFFVLEQRWKPAGPGWFLVCCFWSRNWESNPARYGFFVSIKEDSMPWNCYLFPGRKPQWPEPSRPAMVILFPDSLTKKSKNTQETTLAHWSIGFMFTSSKSANQPIPFHVSVKWSNMGGSGLWPFAQTLSDVLVLIIWSRSVTRCDEWWLISHILVIWTNDKNI